MVPLGFSAGQLSRPLTRTQHANVPLSWTQRGTMDTPGLTHLSEPQRGTPECHSSAGRRADHDSTNEGAQLLADAGPAAHPSAQQAYAHQHHLI
jgi:hypothetical protein